MSRCKQQLDLIVLRPSHARLRGPFHRGADRERQGVHVDVLDQLVGDVGLEEPVHVQRAGLVPVGFARESGLNGDVWAQPVWRTGRQYPTHAFDGLGQAVAVTEGGDEAPQVVGRAARVVACDESPHSVPEPPRQLGLERPKSLRGGHPPLHPTRSRLFSPLPLGRFGQALERCSWSTPAAARGTAAVRFALAATVGRFVPCSVFSPPGCGTVVSAPPV